MMTYRAHFFTLGYVSHSLSASEIAGSGSHISYISFSHYFLQSGLSWYKPQSVEMSDYSTYHPIFVMFLYMLAVRITL